jgi:hypothetical protein
MLQLASIKKEEMTSGFLADLHKSTFGAEVPGDYFRFDGCLVAKNDEPELVSYVLVREVSSDTVEMAWGGTSTKHRGISSVAAFHMFVEHLHRGYENVMFQAWNKNHPMIRLGLTQKFEVIGCRTASDGSLFVIFNKKRGE